MQTLAEAKEQIAFLFTDHLEHDRSILVPKKRETGETVTALSRVTVALRFLDPFTEDASSRPSRPSRRTWAGRCGI